MSFGVWDVALVMAVTAQVAVVAYLYDPRWKAFALMLPVPFTLACLALNGAGPHELRHPVDATNVLGLGILLLFANAVRWLHSRAGFWIIASILLAAVICCVIAMLVQPLVHKDNVTFFACAAIIAVIGVIVLFNSPHVDERGHRTPLPIYVKLPGIAAMVVILVLLKGLLGGFMTAFPMVTIFAAYESRHSLATLCRQIPVIMLTLLPLMTVVRLTQYLWGLGPALAIGWALFLIILFPINSLTRARSRDTETESTTTSKGVDNGNPNEKPVAGRVPGWTVD